MGMRIAKEVTRVKAILDAKVQVTAGLQHPTDLSQCHFLVRSWRVGAWPAARKLKNAVEQHQVKALFLEWQIHCVEQDTGKRRGRSKLRTIAHGEKGLGVVIACN